MSLRLRMHTDFPFSRVFVLGVVLSLLGLASMIICIVAFVTQSWGHYAGTGMWGGAIILASGLTAVFLSQLRSHITVKSFCVLSVIAMFTSLIMLILSAGGLTLNSGFYSHIDLTDYNKRISNLIHASLLIISVFCLTGSILAVIVCCKFLIFEHHAKPKCHRHNRNILLGTIGGAPNSSNIRSANSRKPLHGSGYTSHRHSNNVDVNRVPIEFGQRHKNSTSNQPHFTFNPQRERHSHRDSRRNNTNLLSPCGTRNHPDGRNGSNRNSREMAGDSQERRRLNIIPLREMSSRPFSQVQIHARLSRNLISTSPKIHLPTEFCEEELPPYRAVESSTSAITGSHSDSGDESDTENSSGTYAHSCGATDLGEEGADTVPIGEAQNSHIQENYCTADNSKQCNTANFKFIGEPHSNTASSHRVPDGECTSERQTHSLPSSSDCRVYVNSEITCGIGAAIITEDFERSGRFLLSYTSTHPLGQKDCEHQLPVSAEICAITGGTLKDAPNTEACVPHLNDNCYENSPCYDNIRCTVRSIDNASMNYLSKSSSVNLTKTVINASSLFTTEKEAQSRSPTPGKTVPVRAISSPAFNMSPQSPQSNFGSTLSAFRPVGTASSLSPLSIGSPTNPLFHPNDYSPHDNVITVNKNSSPHIYVNAHAPLRIPYSVSSPIGKYTEQGAIPKVVRYRGEIPQCNNSNTYLSWKNIQPVVSYNHSESVSNESENKLPSKVIPFADSEPEILDAATSSKIEAPSSACVSFKLSPHVNPLNNLVSSTVSSFSSSVLAPKSLLLPVSAFGAGTEAVLSAPAKLINNSICDAADPQSQQTSASSAAVLSNITLPLVIKSGTLVSSVSTSPRWHSRRIEENKALLQSRCEELQKPEQCQCVVETSTRAVRPSSIPLSGGSTGICHGISGLTTDRQPRNRTVEASSRSSVSANSTHHLPLSSHLACHPGQQPQSLVLRQNHLLQHYPLQPQQPRLGVQLHQRRQQQLQLQQNIESQQQHQQMQQQQRQQPLQSLQQGSQQILQGQQGRNGRPLFSVLL